MDPNDKIFEDLTERQLQSLRYDASVRKKVLTILKKLENDIVNRITDKESFTQRRLQSLLDEVRKSINNTYRIIDKEVSKEMLDFGKVEAKSFETILAGAAEIASVKVTVKSVVDSIQSSLIAGAPSEEWWSRQSNKLNERFSDQMRTGILLGESNDRLIRRVRGTRAFGYTNGIMNSARNDAEALVRSSVQSAANNARFEVMEANHSIIKSYLYVSTLDGRTSDVCIVRDGKRWDAKTKKPIGHNLAFQVPPIHWNCRSTLITELRGVDLPDDATRASPDGQVPASTTFSDFLKKKGNNFSEEVLGKGKAKLYNDGKITLRQLLDQSGNPLTLKELKQKYDN